MLATLSFPAGSDQICQRRRVNEHARKLHIICDLYDLILLFGLFCWRPSGCFNHPNQRHKKKMIKPIVKLIVYIVPIVLYTLVEAYWEEV